VAALEEELLPLLPDLERIVRVAMLDRELERLAAGSKRLAEGFDFPINEGGFR
jgi:hypothetical protein